MKRKAIYFGLVALTAILFAGCGKKTQEESETEKTEQTKKQDQDTTESTSSSSEATISTLEETVEEGFEKVGGEGHGYVVIPDTWVEFNDPQAPEDMQYMVSNVILTLGTPLSKVSESKLQEIVNALVDFNLSRGALNSELSETKVNGVDAQVILLDFGKNFYLKIYCFVLDDITHIVSIEGDLTDVESAGKWVEETFTSK